MGAVVPDSNVVLAVFDGTDAHHAAGLAAVNRHRAAGDRFVLPAVVYAEVLVGAVREGSVERRRRQLLDTFGVVRPVDAEVAEIAAELRGRHRGLRLPDALVVATGVVDGAAVLTFDRALGRVDECVTVVA